MNKGGTIDFGFCQVSQVTADHSSCCVTADGHIETGGDPTGFVITLPHLNQRIYHGGDTNVFSDMKIISDLHDPTIIMIPIGDRFTMGPREASYACNKFFNNVQWVVPMHFGTFPLLTGTMEDFKKALGDFPINKVIDTPSIKDTPEATWKVVG
uniref:Metallo-beta-lactamase domain-containing protein n=1 Tax=Strombidium inclinatum TaxID=197538 RepID=A0A7S3IWT1_9SPIT|mmetsp:Transcript_6544/g.10519  ORF Transcript_6544/g.10519 Transcript_6544/m.10519 type:complete len:154 (+) Transcript_6544:322-783(+)